MWRKFFVGFSISLLIFLVTILFTAKYLVKNIVLEGLTEAGCINARIDSAHLRRKEILFRALHCEFNWEGRAAQIEIEEFAFSLNWREITKLSGDFLKRVRSARAKRVRFDLSGEQFAIPVFDLDLENGAELSTRFQFEIPETGRHLWRDDKQKISVYLAKPMDVKLSLRGVFAAEKEALAIATLSAVPVSLRIQDDARASAQAIDLLLQNFTLEGSRLRADALLERYQEYKAQLPLTISGDLNTKEIEIKTQGKLGPVQSVTFSPPALFSELNPEAKLQLVSATPEIYGKFMRNKDGAISGELRVRIHADRGTYEKIEFSNLTIESNFDLKTVKEKIKFRPRVRVNWQAIDFGIPALNGKLSLATNSYVTELDHLTLETMRFTVFGGEVYAGPKRFRITEKEQKLEVKFSGIQIEQLVKLDTKGRVQGTGIMDGSLPITISSRGAAIDKGLLQARSPGGSLQYRDEAAAAVGGTNQNLNFALKALEDFRYSKLDSEVSYAPDGSLLLGLRLEGKNPGVFNGKAIHFNINVEQNVLQLLKSLQIANELDDSLDRKFRK